MADSVLRLRQENDHAIELLAHADLARKPRIVTGAIRELEHVSLHIRRSTHLGLPVRMDMNVTRAARGTPATIAVDSRYLILDRPSHQRFAFSQLDRAAVAAK
jgi:hypothetical protein